MSEESKPVQDIPVQGTSVKRSTIDRMKPKEVATLLTRLGLGFGIDATSRNPWGQKSVCQVCRIQNEDDVVIIDEGGNWQSFYQKVESQRELQGKLSSSVTVPNSPVSIAAGLEMSRKKVRSREVFGRRLVDCKASLRLHSSSSPVKPDDFEVMLSSWIVDRIRRLANKLQSVTGNLPCTELEDLPADVAKFGLSKTELKLAIKAVKHKSALRDKNSQPAPTGGMQKEEEESDLASNAEHVQNTEWELLVELCREFIREHKVTHYASTIVLGVAEYQVKEITTQVDQKRVSESFTLYQSIQASAGASSVWKRFSEDTHTVTRGVTKGDEIERPAVLDVDVLPITDRVKAAKLQMALQQALVQHFEEYYQDVDHQFEKGPFKFRITIPCSPNYYLYVQPKDREPQKPSHETQLQPQSTSKQQQQEEAQDSVEPQGQEKAQDDVKLQGQEAAQDRLKRMGHALLVSKDEEKASRFFLVPVDEKEADEFYIVFYHENLVNKGGRYVPERSVKSIPYYLQVNPPWLRRESINCLQFSAIPTENSKFRFLRSGSFNTGSESSLIKAAEEKPIYIQCPQYLFRTGYVCMFKSEQPSIGWNYAIDANKNPPHYFLFNLIPATPPSTEQDRNAIPDPAASLHRGQGTALPPLEANVTYH